MKTIKLLTLAIALSGSIAPAQSMQAEFNTTKTIESINEDRVQEAYEAYKHEAQWAPAVRYAAFGTLSAVAVYGLYSWLKKTPCPACSLARTQEEQNAFIALLQASKNKTNEWGDTFVSAGSSIVSWAAFSYGLTATQSLGSYAYGAVSPFIPTIPTTGNLTWYISARTDYNRNINDMQRRMKQYALFQDEIREITDLLVIDIEKIVAYLQHFNEHLATQIHLTRQALAQTTCQRYSNTIKYFTDELVTSINNEDPTSVIIEKLDFLMSEIKSTIVFVSAYHQ
jgi:hypothetical protein